MKKIYTYLFIGLCVLTTQAQDVVLSSVSGGFNSPVGIKHAEDNRLFIVEQNGVIRIINLDDNSTLSTPFLNIDPIVSNSGGERGLLGLAFHPNYAANGFFYVNYINNSGNTVISRFNVSAGDANIADAASEVILLTINQPFGNHNGGDLAFGNDGYLYIATGDGGSANDPQDHGQRLNSLLGKMLRIDVDNGNPYSSPSDNPFVNDGDANTLAEIWAYGLRNPWRFSFDRTNNDIWIADVGQNEWEEINRAGSTEAGLNYGWRCREGMHDFNTAGCPGTGYTEPVAEYNHFNDGEFKCSITGGYRYRGTEFPNFVGLYFFADVCSDEIGFIEDNGGTWDMTLKDFTTGGGWASFGEDVNGELYIASLNNGTIYKIEDGELSVNEFSENSISMYPNPANNELNFNFGLQSVANVIVYDLHGKKIQSYGVNNSEVLNISTKNFANGMYIVEVQNQNGNTVRKKLIVQ